MSSPDPKPVFTSLTSAREVELVGVLHFRLYGKQMQRLRRVAGKGWEITSVRPASDEEYRMWNKLVRKT